MSRKQIIGVAVVVIAVAAIAVGVKAVTSLGALGGMPEHITIAQAMEYSPGQVVKVGGDVVPGSITWDNDSHSLSFTLTGEGDTMTVIYRGLAPKDFKPGLSLVVEGTYTSGGAFQATSLVTRNSPLCMSCHG